MYTPSLLLTIRTHILPGALIFAHLTLLFRARIVLVLLSATKLKSILEPVPTKLGLAATKLEGELLEPLIAVESAPLPCSDVCSCGGDEKEDPPASSLFVLVLVVMYVQSAGEAMARYYAGEGWWHSHCYTWAGRAAFRYAGHLEGNVQSAISAILIFF